MSSLQDMCGGEAQRKLLQLKPLLHKDTLERFFLPEDVKATDLAGLVDGDSFDTKKLIPFIVSALQNLEGRVTRLESTSK